MLLDFAAYPLWLNLAITAAGALVVWLVGSRLSGYADLIADRTGLGKAFVGAILLAVTTSLPEIATTATASWLGNPSLAMNNLFGGVAMQTAVLALADGVAVRGALTYFAPRPTLLLQGVSLVLLITLAVAGTVAPSPVSFFGVGIWSVLVFVFYLLSVYLLRRYEGHGRWRPVDPPEEAMDVAEAREGLEQQYREHSTSALFLRFGLGAVVLLVAGYFVTRSAEALATQTGLGTSFVGATLLALVTSLPEVSTTIAAVRLGSYSLAISNIFGSNAILMSLVLLADVLYREGPILQAVESNAVFAALAGIVLTCIYLVGMIERRDKVVLRVGLDSAVVVVVYLSTLVVLYFFR